MASRGRPRPSTGRPTGGACWTCSRRTRRRRYDDLWRTWVARDEDLPLLDARAAARAAVRRGRSPRPATGSCRGRSATRCGRGGSTTRPGCSTTPTTVLGAARRDRGRRGRRRPDPARPTCGSRSRATDGFAAALDEADAELDAIERYQAAADAEPVGARTSSPRSGLWGATPEADLAAAKAAFAAGDLEAAVSVVRCGPLGLDVGRGRRPGPAGERVGAGAGAGRGPRPVRADDPEPSAAYARGRRLHALDVAAAGRMMARPLEPGEVPGRVRTASPAGPGDRRPAPQSPAPTTVAPTRRSRTLHSPPLRTSRRARPPTSTTRERDRLMGMRRPRPSHEILSGDSADVYFARAEAILEREGLDPLVTMEVFTREDGRPVRDRRGQEPARPRPRPRPTRPRPSSRRSTTAT